MMYDSVEVLLLAAHIVSYLDRDFKSIKKSELTSWLRGYAGDGCRLSRRRADLLTQIFRDDYGICVDGKRIASCRPTDYVRLYRREGQYSRYLQLLRHPSPESDALLRRGLSLTP